MSPKYDLVVIGAGPGGYTAAVSAAQHGMKTALVEAREVGGACLNRGCIPTKTLLHSAELYREMKSGEGIGVYAEGLSYDLRAMYSRKDEVVTGLRDGIEALLRANKVELVHGTAKILSASEVLVSKGGESTLLEASKVLIAVGSAPSRPPIDGIDLPGVVTSDGLLEARTADYKSLVIIGGGVIGAEFASVFGALGCEVTIIEAAERIVPALDRELSQNLTAILKKRGVAINTGCSVERISQSGGDLCCRFTGKNGSQELTAQGVLVSVGRRPDTAELFGEGVNIAQGRGIIVDRRFETSEKGIYAIGDVIAGSIALAHAASAQAQNVIAEMVGEKPPVDLSAVPSCVYTSPEIASVGITAEEAKARSVEVIVGKSPMSANGKTVIERQDRSFVKLVFDADSEVLLGAQLMCSRASDIISELSSAILNKLTIWQLASVVRPHPTFSEAVSKAAEDAKERAAKKPPERKGEA